MLGNLRPRASYPIYRLGTIEDVKVMMATSLALDPRALVLRQQGQQSLLQNQSTSEYMRIGHGSALDVESVGGDGEGDGY